MNPMLVSALVFSVTLSPTASVDLVTAAVKAALDTRELPTAAPRLQWVGGAGDWVTPVANDETV